ncbi:hypothetical protein [Neisseria sicca]|uniref:hypothetical protein n=1 Tax=Neisseria sicca TaxID=490 RepID=UPI001649B139|nr:hypothetical protein [Neisseria sicca]
MSNFWGAVQFFQTTFLYFESLCSALTSVIHPPEIYASPAKCYRINAANRQKYRFQISRF